MTLKKTHTIDASGKILGRLSSEIAFLLQGKNFPNYVPYLDNGGEIIVINTSKLKVTAGKMNKKNIIDIPVILAASKKQSTKICFLMTRMKF